MFVIWVGLACQKPGDMEDTASAGVLPSLDTGYVELVDELIDADDCADLPDGRLYAASTFFVADVPIAYTGFDGETWHTNRGVLVYGGRDAAGAALDDLWLLDLQNAGRWDRDTADSADTGGLVDTCPWVQLNVDATPTTGLAGATLNVVGDHALLTGGYSGSGTSWVSTGAARTAALSTLETVAFVPQASGNARTAMDLWGASGCEPANTAVYCFRDDHDMTLDTGLDPECEVLAGPVSGHDPCDPLDWDYSAMGLNSEVCGTWHLLKGDVYSACSQDPTCTGNPSTSTVATPGPSFHAALPLSDGSVGIVGGVSGCTGSTECTDTTGQMPTTWTDMPTLAHAISSAAWRRRLCRSERLEASRAVLQPYTACLPAARGVRRPVPMNWMGPAGLLEPRADGS